MALNAGTLDEHGNLTTGSMARAIDDELLKIIPLGPNEDPRARRKVMVAIAQGVVNHLVANNDAFLVTVPVTFVGQDEKIVQVQIEKT